MTTPKVAIFYDWLNCWGGAERLLLQIIKVFPQAKLYTTIYNPNQTKWLPKNIKISPSFLNKYFQKNTPLLGLLQAIAVESFDFSNFDIVISITSLNGKAIITPPHTLHICYCLNPNRRLYQKKYPPVIKPILNKFRQIDKIYANRPDKYLTTSKTVQKRIKDQYRLPSTVVYPGIDTGKFKPTKIISANSYFLTVSRLVVYKNIDKVIQAFKNIDDNLYIVGTGQQKTYLKKLAKHKPNIKFLGRVSDKKLINLYQNCQALICPQVEDFGLTSLEAQACGRPVIGLNQAGITETVINNKTGILFNKPTIKHIQKAIQKFKTLKLNTANCRQQAIKFSHQNFMLNFKRQVLNQWQQHRNEQIITS